MNEAELLFTEVLNCDRVSLFTKRNSRLGKEHSTLIASVLKRRMHAEPIQYILGKTEFMGFEFRVTPDVLTPRPETEILVETVLSSSLVPRPSSMKILDLGTGSGCIAVALAKLLSGVEITATDISESALEVARPNAMLNNVEDRIEFVHGDLFNTYGLRLTTYDLIISNPPYIPDAELAFLQPEISYEPEIALRGGEDGLDFYRRIINEAPGHLKDNGLLIMEMGFGQRQAIENIFKTYAGFQIIEVIRDYNNIDRVIVARKAAGSG